MSFQTKSILSNSVLIRILLIIITHHKIYLCLQIMQRNNIFNNKHVALDSLSIHSIAKILVVVAFKLEDATFYNQIKKLISSKLLIRKVRIKIRTWSF
jgi:hypothetical protein